MRDPIFKTTRRGLMGDKPLGPEYMPEVNERARRLRSATKDDATDPRQLRIPFPAATK